MFRRIAAFELRYQVGSPVFWVAFGIFFLLTFGATTIPQITIGDKGGTHVNAPYAIVQILGLMSLFAIFILTAFVANVVVRDDETGFGPIVRATPIRKFDYLFGRFSGAFVAGAIAFLSVPLGILVGSFMPWVDAMKLGPFQPEDYLYAYFLIALPTLFVMASIFFALATVTRSMLGTYLGVVGFLIAYLVLTALFSKPEFDHIVGVLEPTGLGAISEATKYWTAYERNSLLPPLQGIVLENRAIWFGVSLLMLALAWALMRFETRGARERGRGEAEAPVAPAKPAPLPQPRFDRRARAVQAWKWTRFEMAQLFRSPAYFVLLTLGLINAGASMWSADETFDFKLFPVTRVMIDALSGSFTIIPLIIAIYYAGELVWRERERRTHELFESAPLPDWAFVLPKIAAIVLVLVSTFLVSVIAAVLVQTIKGYHTYELGHYFAWYVAPETVRAVLLAVLAVFVQALSPQKYVGWGIMALYLVAMFAFRNIGLENHLYLYGTTPEVPLSDMNGEGQFWIARAWFDAYWSAIALLLTVFAYALWRRGTEIRFIPRLRRLPARLSGLAGVFAGLGVLVAIGTGAFITYNIKVLNVYRTTIEDDRLKAEFEKTLLRFQHVPQPHVVHVVLNVVLDPHHLRAITNGSYVIVNRTRAPLDHVHVRWEIGEVTMPSLSVEGAHVEKRYNKFHYVIYAFDRPMQPGEKRWLRFTSVYAQQGFRNRDNENRLVDNGTFLNNIELGPRIGMDQDGLLDDPAKRRRYGLPGEIHPPRLEDDRARAYNYLGHDADWVTSDITVSTVADQTPIAPGYTVFDHIVGGRRIARFVSDAPILDFFSIQSARYAVRRDRWHGVNLAVYYDAKHPYDVERMITAMKASFDVYTKAFSPFQFHQMRILEFPAYESFAQSFANTVPYSENLGFIQNWDAIRNDPEKVDMVTYVTAHEVGHQWWAHQIIGADMQGSTMLSETFAQYSALLVMEHLYGPEHVRKFLKWSLDRYLRSRGTEDREEMPLERVENQPYVHYWKGAVVMYRLKETVGEDVVDRSLRRLLAQYAFKPAPYPSSKDFIKILREEAGPKYDSLISDLFERITLYDLKAIRTSATRRADGKYDVALTVEAHKFYADGRGRETEAPMKEDVDIGLFLTEPGKAGFDAAKILYYSRLPIVTGRHTLHFVTNRAPRFGGIDPYNIWIDRNADDNLISASTS